MKAASFKSGIIAALFMFFIVGAELDAIAKPPPWAPAHGYKAKTRYVYFPQQNIYYDLKTNKYIYLSGSSWLYGISLPSFFGPVDLITARQVELDYYYSKPYVYNHKHVVIYDSPAKLKVVTVKPAKGNKYQPKGSSGSGKGKAKGPK